MKWDELIASKKPFDASGIPNPRIWQWEEEGGIFYPSELLFPFYIHLRGDYSTKEVWLDDRLLDPRRSLAKHNHSLDGFNWGYGGSGPAQLALAIVLELTGRSHGYQDFKWKYIATLPEANFDMDIKIEEFY